MDMRYQILDLIGTTAGSHLYRAQSLQDGAAAVLKVLDPEHATPAQSARFQREYEILSSLDLPGVAKPVALIQEQGPPVIVLDCAAGELLETVLTLGRLDVPTCLRLASQLAGILAGLHAAHLTHRDMRPANLMLTPEGRVFLLDLSLATLDTPETAAADIPPSGDWAYLSPEQTGRMNRSVDYRTDFYSLGVTLYRMLTGQLPFQGHDALEWVHCHIARLARPPAEVSPDVPPVVSDIVMKLLAKLAEDRYQSANGLLHDLESCLAQWEKSGTITPFTLAAQDVSERFRIPQKLYGRQAEAMRLLEAFDGMAATGQPALVLVYGYSGIGKSALVYELNQPVVREGGYFVSGKFDQYLGDIPYASITQALRELVQQILAESDERVVVWRHQLQEALAGNGQLVVDLIPQLSLVLGPQPPLAALPPAEAQDRFHTAFRRFIGVFTRKAQPLVLFLDDVQWIDSASLKLIEHLITHPDTRYLLLIAAYRDNEVSAAHPLLSSLNTIRNSGTKVTDIQLGPLPLVHLNQLVADTLHAEMASCESLTRLVFERTEGNPFFFTQFLAALHEEGLLQWEATNRSWQWDLGKIAAKDFADNAAELMAGKLRRLPVPAREALPLAACLGNKFDLGSLALVIRHSEAETEQSLRAAINEHLIIRTDSRCKFLHDRIQQAAYSLIPEGERAAVHLQIGRSLSTLTAPEKLEEKIFEIVKQFDHGAALLTAPQERERVAELNLIAGRRAKASAAYDSALHYFSAGIRLLGEDPWARGHDLAWQLGFERAEAEFLCRRFDESLRQFDALLAHAETNLEKANIWRVVVDVHTTTVELDKAIACGLEALRLFGIDIPRRPTSEQVTAEYDTIWESLGGRPIEDLIDSPLMTDPEMKGAMAILVILFAPSIAADRNLLLLCACHMVNMSIRYGNSDASVMAYGYLGMNLGPFFGKYREGFRFGMLGYDLVEKRGLVAYRAKINFIIGAFIDFWNRPAGKGIEHLGAAFKAAVDAGDLNIASYACDHLVSHRLVSGEPLDKVYLESEELLDFTRRAKFDPSSQIIIRTQRFIQALQGLTANLASFSGDRFDQDAYEEFMDHYGWVSITCGYYIMKLQALVLSGDFEAAAAAGAKAKPLLWSIFGMVQEAEYGFYSALALAARYPRAAPELQPAYLRELVAFRDRLGGWTDNCPENFLNRYALVSAEIARIEGREMDAMRLYQEAIRSARENGFVQNEAMAYEIASEFYRARGFELFAEAYLREARSCYARWGAVGKVKALDARHPGPEAARLSPGAAIGASAEQLDVVTVVKASQAVSGEIVLSKLIETLMTIAMEHAGAQRGLLILPEGQGFRIVAEAVAGPDQVRVVLRQAPVTPAELPESALRYVLRTRESVILDDATAVTPFRDDEYLRLRRPRSVLCLPMVKQTKLVGALYLENNLAPGAFTADRVRLLDLLASQAVISLENAGLYADLQEREARIRRLVESNIIGILFFDLAGNITAANEAFLAMVGYSREDLLSGKVRWADMTPPEWRALDEQAVEDLTATGRSKTFEKEYIRRDGSRVPILLAGAMFEGAPDQGVAFVLDLTDLKRATQALRKAHEELEQKVIERTRELSAANVRLKELDRLKSMFIASMSHELRTPLNSVIGFSSILLEEWTGPLNGEQKESLEAILRSGKHLLSLINDVIDVSKIEAGMIESQVEEFDIADVLSEAAKTFTKEVKDKGLDLQVNSVHQTVRADRRRLLQCLLNLISNAVKFTEKGAISVVAAPLGRPRDGAPAGLPRPEDNGCVEISVSDTGIGIREEDLPQLFLPFVRLESPLRSKVPGTGLGLYLTKKLVSEILRGGISCQSRYEEGSTFVIRMPVRI